MTRPPTVDQLRNLADRAEHGLTADEQARLRDGIARLAEYEHTINWHTTCTGCARILDSCIRDTERAERAEAALERVRKVLADRRTEVAEREADGMLPFGAPGASWCDAVTVTCARVEDALRTPAEPQGVPALDEPAPATPAGPRHDDGPTVTECREADRRWPLQKAGE
ncbi:hypothetical protein SAMN06272781_6857 [Streptomyces sp. 1222.2]|uniref:hypothetical protein n=1 Tax=Streptomyces sp. 1222.2 TaxID=1938833 RepID=UPI000BD462A7|nr:hypothetical protein [Streptomyces sp. 1222.2]SOD80079.1 hypothetical protein SAMN06272781_6857 [Streptomyces sp. 1222.2]